MSDNRTFKVSARIAGVICAATVCQFSAAARAENPFAMTPLSQGYQMVAEGKCGGGMQGGKCGEGKCGMRRMDANADGKVTREEFMQGHEAMFDRFDTNGDGVLDADERRAHKEMMRKKKGKCGEGKCGQGKGQ